MWIHKNGKGVACRHKKTRMPLQHAGLVTKDNQVLVYREIVFKFPLSNTGSISIPFFSFGLNVFLKDMLTKGSLSNWIILQ